jgi:hypothetical protein
MALSRQGRRLRGPIPGWVSGLGGFILFGYAAAFAADTAGRLSAANVTYEIGGTGLANVELTSPGDHHIQLRRTAVPLRRDFVFHHGDTAFVSVSGVGGGLVGCRVMIDTRIIAERTGQDVTCGGKIGGPTTDARLGRGVRLRPVGSGTALPLPRRPQALSGGAGPAGRPHVVSSRYLLSGCGFPAADRRRPQGLGHHPAAHVRPSHKRPSGPSCTPWS